jgi:hypothetical protein
MTLYNTLKMAGFHAAAHTLGDRPLTPEKERAWLLFLDSGRNTFLSITGLPYTAPARLKDLPKVPGL